MKNILYCTDRRFIRHNIVSITSLILSNPESRFRIVLLVDFLDKNLFQQISEYLARKGSEINIEKVDHEVFKLSKVYSYYSKANYYRLLVSHYFPEGRVLYLDSDTIIIGAISELFQLKLNSYCLAAVEDANFFDRHSKLRMKNSSKYFNSGVLLIDVEKWRENELVEKTLDLANQDLQFYHQDQECLNSVIDGEWLKLSPRYNLQSPFFSYHEGQASYSINEVKQSIDHPIIAHFTGGLKPWHFRDTNPNKFWYWYFLKKSVVSHMLPKELSFIDQLKWLYLRYFDRSKEIS